ncbi:MAG: GTPase ObgE [Deltaproteobacteria bacterium]|nr:GTPase ObgE [Deltaproteobacteria bacterium]
MKFIDEAKVFVQAGRGGDGSISFRREKYIPKGGPDGGDGGHGGDIIIKADSSCSTLLHLRYHSHFIAGNGVSGKGKKMTGRNADPIEIRVPLGTLLKTQENKMLCDMKIPGQEFIVARGGRGGLGNCHFVSSTHQAPRRATHGKEGESIWLHLELKLFADVGIIGFPNAGKSTLLSRISNAKPKIADYPFTTLEPHLGVVKIDHFSTFVVADIPGLIEGAHLGAGLGHRFLKHIDRTQVLLHILDVSEPEHKDPIEHFEILNAELNSYNPSLLKKKQFVALNKIDVGQKDITPYIQYFKKKNIPAFPISAATGNGIQKLIYQLAHAISSTKNEQQKTVA